VIYSERLIERTEQAVFFGQGISPDPKIHQVDSHPKVTNIFDDNVRFLNAHIGLAHYPLISNSNKNGEDNQCNNQENACVDYITL
jgi:hypothetical protein